MAAKDRCNRLISFGEFATYVRTPCAHRPYTTKITRVMAIKRAESNPISSRGVGVPVGTNCGKKGRKKIESVGFKMLIRKPRRAIRQALLL